MFRTRLRELRESAGYKSQQSFADAFHVAQSTVAGWESGKREPNFDTMIRLSEFFGTSVDDLLGRPSFKVIGKTVFTGADDWSWDGHRLRETRILMGKSEEDAASQLGLPLPVYREIENSTLFPSVPLLQKMSAIFYDDFASLAYGGFRPDPSDQTRAMSSNVDKVLSYFVQLNDRGQNVAIGRIMDLRENDEYLLPQYRKKQDTSAAGA